MKAPLIRRNESGLVFGLTHTIGTRLSELPEVQERKSKSRKVK